MYRGWLALVAVLFSPVVASATGEKKDICYECSEVNVRDGAGGSLRARVRDQRPGLDCGKL